jgi:hypothetical protein
MWEPGDLDDPNVEKPRIAAAAQKLATVSQWYAFGAVEAAPWPKG